MIKTTSPIYQLFLSNHSITDNLKTVSTNCLELSDRILETIPLNSELNIVPYIGIEDNSILFEYDTEYGEFSLWVIDNPDFYVEWSFSVKNCDVYIDGFCTSMEQIIFLTQNSSFGGHK